MKKAEVQNNRVLLMVAVSLPHDVLVGQSGGTELQSSGGPQVEPGDALRVRSDLLLEASGCQFLYEHV